MPKGAHQHHYDSNTNVIYTKNEIQREKGKRKRALRVRERTTAYASSERATARRASAQDMIRRLLLTPCRHPRPGESHERRLLDIGIRMS